MADIPKPLLDFQFTLGTMRRFKQARGKDATEIKMDDPEDFVAVLWAGIGYKHRELTVDDVAEMMTPRNVKDVMRFVTEVINASLPDQDEGEQKNPQAQST